MTFRSRALVAMAWLCMSVAPLGLAFANGEAELRAQLAQERRQIAAAHLERERRCAEQFVVTACLETSRAQQREALAALEARESALDDAERRQRAIERQARIDAKVARQAASASAPDREPVPLMPARAAARASAVSPAPPSESAGSQPAPSRAPRVSPEEVKLREAESRARFDAREKEAQQRQRAAAERQRERDLSGKPVAPALAPTTSSSSPR